MGVMANSREKGPEPDIIGPGIELNQEYELVPIGGDHDVLKEHPQNPRRGDVEAIDESIEVNGWFGAVTAQRSTGYILAGNHRFRAAMLRSAEHIPTIFVDVDDETAIRILLADNKTADLGSYDEEVLSQLLDGLESLAGTGFKPLEVAEAKVSAQPYTEPPEDFEGGDGEVPEDVYEPAFGVMIVCTSEKQQETTYQWLQEQLPDRQLRVVSV